MFLLSQWVHGPISPSVRIPHEVRNLEREFVKRVKEEKNKVTTLQTSSATHVTSVEWSCSGVELETTLKHEQL